MEQLRGTLSRLVGGIVREQMKRGVAALTLFTLAFLFLLLALGFTIGGIYAAIESPLGPIAARFIVAGGALVFVLVLAFAAGSSLKSDRRPRKGEVDEATADQITASGLGDIAASFASGFIRGLTRRRKE